MSNRLKKPKNTVRQSLEELRSQAYSLIDNIKARYSGGFGMTDSSVPSSYTDIVNHVNKWLRKCQEILLSLYELAHIAKEFEYISEIPGYDPSATAQSFAEHLKKRIDYFNKLLTGLESDEEGNDLIFISCGQREEKSLGKHIADLVKNLTGFTPYFAPTNNALEQGKWYGMNKLLC